MRTAGDGKGPGVYALRSYRSGKLIAVVTGEITGEKRLHTLQLTPDSHLF
ncbi:MAG: hypothetical protein JW820_05370 [Spirochaetales bacterium]|nr:hypothetical protein [Spirochaetales bacterium]